MPRLPPPKQPKPPDLLSWMWPVLIGVGLAMWVSAVNQSTSFAMACTAGLLAYLWWAMPHDLLANRNQKRDARSPEGVFGFVAGSVVMIVFAVLVSTDPDWSEEVVDNALLSIIGFFFISAMALGFAAFVFGAAKGLMGGVLNIVVPTRRRAIGARREEELAESRRKAEEHEAEQERRRELYLKRSEEEAASPRKGPPESSPVNDDPAWRARRERFAVELLEIDGDLLRLRVEWVDPKNEPGDGTFYVVQLALWVSSEGGEWVASPRFPLVFGPTVQTVTLNYKAVLHYDRPVHSVAVEDSSISMPFFDSTDEPDHVLGLVPQTDGLVLEVETG